MGRILVREHPLLIHVKQIYKKTFSIASTLNKQVKNYLRVTVTIIKVFLKFSKFCIMEINLCTECLKELIVLRAIRDVNVPKFLQDDLKLFNGIVSDLFPDIQ